MDQYPPPVDQHTPLVEQYPPPVDQYKPLVEQYPPPVDQYMPLVDQYPPPVDQYPPLVDQYKPLIEQYPPLYGFPTDWTFAHPVSTHLTGTVSAQEYHILQPKPNKNNISIKNPPG